MELFSIPCTTCGARLKVKSQAALGQIFNCPKCQSMVLVQAPPDWKPPAIPPLAGRTGKPKPVARPATTAMPEALEVPVATLETPPELGIPEGIEIPWQSPVEARWQRGKWLVAGGVAIVLIATAALWVRSTRPPAARLVLEETMPAEPATSPAEVPLDEPAAVQTPVVATEPPPLRDESIPHLWLPAGSRLVLTLPLSDLAQQEIASELLSSGSSPLRQTLAELRTTFRLSPDQIRRLTWAATDESSDLRHAALVIELAQPLEDDAALVRDCVRLELLLGEALCHQPPVGAWPHPFAVVDPITIVTGPRELLTTIDPASADTAQSPPMRSSLSTLSDARAALAVDREKWLGWKQLQWPPTHEETLALGGTWSAIADSVQSFAISLTVTDGVSARIDLVCPSDAEAAAVVDHLRQFGGKWPELAELRTEGSIVHCRAVWSDDARPVAATLIASLPRWERPAPQAAIAAAPRVQTVSAQPPAVQAVPPPEEPKESPFERQVARRMEERIPAITLRGMPLSEFAAFVARMTGISIALDEATLSAAGITPQATIDVQLTSATIGEVLAAALSSHELAWIAQPNRLLITTRAKAGDARQP